MLVLFYLYLNLKKEYMIIYRRKIFLADINPEIGIVKMIKSIHFLSIHLNKSAFIY